MGERKTISPENSNKSKPFPQTIQIPQDQIILEQLKKTKKQWQIVHKHAPSLEADSTKECYIIREAKNGEQQS